MDVRRAPKSARGMFAVAVMWPAAMAAVALAPGSDFPQLRGIFDTAVCF